MGRLLSELVVNVLVSLLVSGFALFAVLKAYDLQRRADRLRGRYRLLYPETRGLARRLLDMLVSTPEAGEESVTRVYNILYAVQEATVLYAWLCGREVPDTTLRSPYPPEMGFHPWRLAVAFLAMLSLLAVAAGYALATAESVWDLLVALYFLGLAGALVLLELRMFKNLDFYLDRLEEGLGYLEKELERLPP